MEDTYARLYEAEQRFGRIFVSFSALAVFIACLGLFGLASFAAERRTKEIGVRKVLGASTQHLIGLLSNEFVRLVIVANVLAWPLAYAGMSRWLDDFAYRIEPGLDDLHPGRRPRHGHCDADGQLSGNSLGHGQSGRVVAH